MMVSGEILVDCPEDRRHFDTAGRFKDTIWQTPRQFCAGQVFCALDAPAAMTGSIIDVNGASYLRT